MKNIPMKMTGIFGESVSIDRFAENLGAGIRRPILK